MAKAKRKAVKRKTKRAAPRKKTKLSAAQKAGLFNRKSYEKACKSLEMRAAKALKKFQSSVKKKASPAVIARSKGELLLLLGECNYMTRECMRLAAKQKKQKR